MRDTTRVCAPRTWLYCQYFAGTQKWHAAGGDKRGSGGWQMCMRMRMSLCTCTCVNVHVFVSHESHVVHVSVFNKHTNTIHADRSRGCACIYVRLRVYERPSVNAYVMSTSLCIYIYIYIYIYDVHTKTYIVHWHCRKNDRLLEGKRANPRQRNG